MRPSAHHIFEATPPHDLRSLLFGGLAWYEALDEGDDATWPTWRIAKSHEPAWWKALLNSAFGFAQDHTLVERYRARFSGISRSELRLEKAQRESRTSTFPIWEVANELVVARYLERVLGWRYESHEPPGRGLRRGDWQFLTPSDQRVFVEVKSLREPERHGTGVFNRPSYSARLRGVLKEAYAQLPDDGRATLVVLVGSEVLRIPFGIMHGDLFQALYGRMQVTFNLMPYDSASVRMGPSFRDMFVHGTKHRRLAWAAGLAVSGLDLPDLGFYGIQNPYADPTVRIERQAFPNVDRFVVEESGHGHIENGLHPDEVWQLME